MKKLKIFFLFALMTGQFATVDVLAQNRKDMMSQMLKNSHPGPNHMLLAQLAGTWHFQDSQLSFVKGTVIRKPIYDGRFYEIKITGGKLPLPVSDGKMKEDNYQSLQIEGYDNVKSKFITISLNNHIGSDIQYQEGVYDPKNNTYCYDWNSETVKGDVRINRRIITLIDRTHYSERFYECQNENYVKVRELVYTKIE